MADWLGSLGMKEISGSACYLFFKSEREIFLPLLKKGILIRKCDDYYGIPSRGYYRIAIKSKEENDVLIEALRNC